MLQGYIDEGKALLLSVRLPSKNQLRNKKKIQRSKVRASFYKSVFGKHMDGLFVAVEPINPVPHDPLKLLVVWRTVEGASWAQNQISKVKFTDTNFDFTIGISRGPQLKLNLLTHAATGHTGNQAGKRIAWGRLTVQAHNLWSVMAAESAISRVKAGELSLDDYASQGEVNDIEMAEKEVAEKGIEQNTSKCTSSCYSLQASGLLLIYG